MTKIEALKIVIDLMKADNNTVIAERLTEILEDYEDGDEGIVKCGCCGKQLKRCEAFLVNDDRLYTCNDCPEKI